MTLNLNNQSILVTGGAGSFGKAFVKTILEKYPDVKKIIIYSRDEAKHFELNYSLNKSQYPNLQYMIGDIRDKDRLQKACQNIDIVIHAAAFKQINTAEQNPTECIKTNIIGTENVIDAALNCQVKKVILLSTDKAVYPTSVYGATKLCAEKLFLDAHQNYTFTKFSIVRYGNMMGSSASVAFVFHKNRNNQPLQITHPASTRFAISLQKSVDMMLEAIKNSQGGEIFIPKMPSFKILDLANIIANNCEKEIIGLRQGEKLHEHLFAQEDMDRMIENEQFFIILPNANNLEEKLPSFKAKHLSFSTIFTSENNKLQLSQAALAEQLKEIFV